MSLYILNHFVLPIFILIFLMAILGYGRLLDKYSEVPWDQNILNENKLNHNYEFINEDNNDFEEEEDLGPYCICSTKNRSPCTVLPCITLAEESAKKGIFLE